MIVCLCRNLSDAAIRAELHAGARTADDVARTTGAGTDCGCCRETLEDLVRTSGPCSVPPCPGCPRAANAPRRDAA